MDAGKAVEKILKGMPRWVTRQEGRDALTGEQVKLGDPNQSQLVTVRNPEAALWAKTPQAASAVAELATLCQQVGPAVKAANVPPNRDRDVLNAWAAVYGFASKGRTDVDSLNSYLTHLPVLAKGLSAIKATIVSDEDKAKIRAEAEAPPKRRGKDAD